MQLRNLLEVAHYYSLQSLALQPPLLSSSTFILLIGKAYFTRLQVDQQKRKRIIEEGDNAPIILILIKENTLLIILHRLKQTYTKGLIMILITQEVMVPLTSVSNSRNTINIKLLLIPILEISIEEIKWMASN